MEPMEQEQAYYETSGHVIAAGITLSLLAIATVVLRFVTRMSKNQGLKMDDWLILPATVGILRPRRLKSCLGCLR